MENLLPEIINYYIFKYLNDIDILNCSVALLGTRNEEFVVHTYLKDQLKILASLDVNLNKSIKNCEFKPELPSKYVSINFEKKKIGISA